MQTVIETKTGWMIKCPNCGWHEYPKVGRPQATWSFNGNLQSPTFSPSMNEGLNQPGPHFNPEHPSRRCHFTVTNGQIKFHDDCTHGFKGQTLPLESWPDSEVAMHAFALKE
jgi:hypothetical protein